MRRSAKLIIGVLWLVPSVAFAFNAQGQRWPNTETQPVSYMLEAAGSDDVTDGSDLAAIRRAFATWQQVVCSTIRFEERSWVGPARVQNDGQNQVMWVESESLWPGQPGTLALTYTFYTLDEAREIRDADMILNGVHWTWTTVDDEVGQGTPAKVDVETVVFHEVGHFFGLEHSQDTTAAMYPSNNKPIQRQPATDDIYGICTLYPSGEPVPSEPGGEGAGVGAPCNANENCASSLCLADDVLSLSYCTARCTPSQSNCPQGYVCEDSPYGALCFLPLPVDELCDLCGNSGQCDSGLCLHVPGINFERPFCTRACDPTPGQAAQCPNGFQCIVTQTGTGFIGACVPSSGVCDPSGKGGQNERCFADGSCKSGHSCLQYFPGEEPSFCFAQCPNSSIGDNCGIAGTLCTPVNGIDNLNVCLSYAREGELCIPEQCEATAFCAWDESVGQESALCYRMCPNGQPQCPANTACNTYPGLPPLCEPMEGFKFDGQPCLSDAECESRTCRVVGEVRRCTRTCAKTNAGDCGSGLICLTGAGSDQGLCWPESDVGSDEPDPGRGGSISGEYCACDSTNACDDDCACDPECSGSVCSCRTVSQPFPAVSLWVGGFLLSMQVLRRRRR